MGRLALNDGGIFFQAVRFLDDVFLSDYIPGNFYYSERGFKFMGEVVDKIFLHFGQKFLPVKIEKADGESDQCQGKRHAANDPEVHFSQYIQGAMWEIQ